MLILGLVIALFLSVCYGVFVTLFLCHVVGKDKPEDMKFEDYDW